ncbi:hypothetical protein Taro_044593, partial [Colocasia esculenta]|nr:hypothetical protein [Colocasia esculenta]
LQWKVGGIPARVRPGGSGKRSIGAPGVGGEDPPIEREVPEIEMEEEEEVEAPTVNVEEERKKRAKAMKSLASEPGAQADLDLRRFLVLFLGRLLFATRGDAVHCRFLPLLEDLSEVGGYAWGAAFLEHQFDSLGTSERQTSTSGFFPFLQVWAYLHLPALGRGDLTQPGLVPIARRWDSRRDTRHLADQLERLQEAIDSYPYLDVVWQPYLGEGDEGQPGLVQARPYFGRSVWLHALNFVLPLHLHLCQRSLGLRQSVVEFPIQNRFRRPGQSFRGLHDTTNWRERAREQIENWERKGKAVKSDATTDDAYLQAYALKWMLLARLHRSEPCSTRQSRIGRQLRAERVGESEGCRSRRCLLFSERRGLSVAPGGPAGRGGAESRGGSEAPGGAEAAEAQVTEATRELAALRVQRPPGDQEEIIQLRAELLAKQMLARSLQQIVTDIGRSRSRSRSGASVSRATGTSVGQYLAGSSSMRRNEEEERRRKGEGSAQDGRGGGEMLPPPDRREGSRESGGG